MCTRGRITPAGRFIRPWGGSGFEILDAFIHPRTLTRLACAVLGTVQRGVILGTGVDGKRGGVLSRYTFEMFPLPPRALKCRYWGWEQHGMSLPTGDGLGPSDGAH